MARREATARAFVHQETAPMAAPAAQAAMPNPSHALQRELAQAVAAGVFEPGAYDMTQRWSPRRTAAFVVVTCGAFWAGVSWIASRLL